MKHLFAIASMLMTISAATAQAGTPTPVVVKVFLIDTDKGDTTAFLPPPPIVARDSITGAILTGTANEKLLLPEGGIWQITPTVTVTKNGWETAVAEPSVVTIKTNGSTSTVERSFFILCSPASGGRKQTKVPPKALYSADLRPNTLANRPQTAPTQKLAVDDPRGSQEAAEQNDNSAPSEQTPAPTQPSSVSTVYYTVQFCSVGQKKKADEIAAMLSRKGVQNVWIQEYKQPQGDTYYRVRSGRFSRYDDAVKTSKQYPWAAKLLNLNAEPQVVRDKSTTQ